MFKLDIPFAAKNADAAKLVAAEYQKLIQSGVLKYKGFVEDLHGSFYVYKHGGNLYLFGKDWIDQQPSRSGYQMCDHLDKPGGTRKQIPTSRLHAIELVSMIATFGNQNAK